MSSRVRDLGGRLSNYMSSILERLWRLGKAAINSGTGSRDVEEELSQWEEELKKSREKKQSAPGNKGTDSKELREAFEVLGVPFGSDYEICKKAHLELVRECHSDKYAESDEKSKTADEALQIVNPAFDLVKKHYGKI